VKNVLIVDDETSFLISLTDGLKDYSNDFNVITAENGKEAVEILQTIGIDLVVTDLKMPVMDGFELLSFLGNKYPAVPVVVMTAFGTPEIEDRTHELGAIQYIEKPLDFRDLAEKIYEGLAAGSKGHISGITLSSFLQLLEIEKKTCTLKITAEDQEGALYLSKGMLLNAETALLQGEEAAYEIVCWDNATIEISSGRKKRNKVIESTLSHILMEGFRRKDERCRNIEERRAEQETVTFSEEETPFVTDGTRSINPNKKEINIMAVQDKLKEFAAIDGFGGVGLFTPTGEVLAMLEAQGSKTSLKEIGVLANNVLMNAQKASLDMGTGRGQLVHVEAEHANIIVRCMNEGTDPLKSQPGKAHVHLVLVLTSDASIGLAKMKVGAIIQQLAEEFRM
jgi:DNA-binding response OmpR family regulator